jgi:hypothetical protein
VDLTSTLEAPCAPDVLYEAVVDLDRYPDWLSIVTRAERLPDGPDDGSEAAGDGPADGPVDRPVWSIDLRGRLGPLARSKRLRMVRTIEERPAGGGPGHVRFERDELDGRSHSPWVLDAVVEPTDAGSRLEMRLHYGGSFGGSLLEHMLEDEIEQSRPRLLELVATSR